VQAVDLGVDGYASDQAYLRLADELPRYSHVVAVVTLFFPRLIDRVAWVDHPRLSFEGDEPRVALGPPSFWTDLRIARIAREVWPGHDQAALELTERVLHETARLADARGARALFLAVHTGPSLPPDDQAIVDKLLVRAGLDTLQLSFEPLADRVHPNRESARRLAQAVVAALGR
jgi:hypothetical protein